MKKGSMEFQNSRQEEDSKSFQRAGWGEEREKDGRRKTERNRAYTHRSGRMTLQFR